MNYDYLKMESQHTDVFSCALFDDTRCYKDNKLFKGEFREK